MVNAIVKPAPLAVNKTIEELHRCLAELNAEIGILLHKRVLDISIQNQDLLVEVRGQRAETEGLRKQLTSMKEDKAMEVFATDNENVENLRRILGQVSDKHKDPDFCGNTLKGSFPESLGVTVVHPGWSQNYTQMTPEVLQSNTAYQSWMKCSSSSLLVLAGATREEGRASHSSLCWLSPAALHIFNRFSSEGKRVAFYSCHPDFREDSSSSRLVITGLLWQILAWKPEILRHKVKDFQSALKSDAWSSNETQMGMEFHVDLLKRVLHLFSTDEEILLVLDRLDLCHISKHQFLKELQNLTRISSLKLKILVIMSRISDDYDREECGHLLSSGAKSYSFGRTDWDQTRKSY